MVLFKEWLYKNRHQKLLKLRFYIYITTYLWLLLMDSSGVDSHSVPTSLNWQGTVIRLAFPNPLCPAQKEDSYILYSTFLRFTYWTPKDCTRNDRIPNDPTPNDRTPNDRTPNDRTSNDRTPNDRTPKDNKSKKTEHRIGPNVENNYKI